MADQPRAGSRVRIIIEDTIEAATSIDLTTTGGIHLTGLDPKNATLTVLEDGWQIGDIVNDGFSDLVRVRHDDSDVWRRLDDDGDVVWDDATSLASLTVIRRAGQEATR